MKTYVQYKSCLDREDYLETLPYEYCRALTRVRISAHNLAIKRGRYIKPPTPIESRTCPHCPMEVEDEFCFLMKCSAYTALAATQNGYFNSI